MVATPGARAAGPRGRLAQRGNIEVNPVEEALAANAEPTLDLAVAPMPGIKLRLGPRAASRLTIHWE